MSLSSISVGCLIVIAFSIFLGKLEFWKRISDSQNAAVVVVGILSARENFIQRETARSTWLQDYLSNNSSSVKAWFVVGNSSCHIPPQYRSNYYSCEKWNLNVSALKENFFTLMEMESRSYERTIHQGFTFKVNHPVIVTRLGILHHALVPNTLSKVAIMDIQSKDYEGLVIFEGYMLHAVNSSIIWNDGGGVITFKRIYLSPHHLDSKKFTSDILSIVSIEFHVDELDDLKKIIEEEASITKQWQLHLEEIQHQIYIENIEHNDLLIVDSVDTYRNLPIKLLKFYKWLTKNESPLYVIKTDDDSIINIEALLEKLQKGSKFHPDHLWLWSRFRKDWPVNYIGKWADDDYRSTYYPIFPCGAAYVMSRQTYLWLSSNSEVLYPYQGEDVSVGIWLSAINPDLIEDENFECSSSCNKNSYNRAQLHPDQMRIIWSLFKKCQNFCTCNEIHSVSVL